MTHDELLRTLNSKNFMESRTTETPYFALRAVVELHKPFTEFGEQGCMQCNNADYSLTEQLYPCPTIQAIRKELG